jgi:hypothetical protein
LHQVTAKAGVDPRLGLSLGHRLRTRGLLDVGHEGRVYLSRGKGPGTRLLRLNWEQMRDAILATGLTAAQFEADLALLDDEGYEARSPTLWTAWGQRPRPR